MAQARACTVNKRSGWFTFSLPVGSKYSGGKPLHYSANKFPILPQTTDINKLSSNSQIVMTTSHRHKGKKT